MSGPLPSELGTLSLLGDMSVLFVLIYCFKKKYIFLIFFLLTIHHTCSRFDGNMLTGTIPTEWGSLQSLKEL